MNWKTRTAYVCVRAEAAKIEQVWRATQAWENTIGSWIVTGEWDIIVWVDAPSWDDVYKIACDMRSWEGVRSTASHFVYNGHKGGEWWWDKPAGTWVMARDPNLNGNIDDLSRKTWITSVASVPGPWDYVVWVSGNTWDEVWSRVWELNKAGWETLTTVPIRSYWNLTWKDKWWQDNVQPATAMTATL